MTNEITYPAGQVADTKYGRNALHPAWKTCECGIDHPRKYVCTALDGINTKDWK